MEKNVQTSQRPHDSVYRRIFSHASIVEQARRKFLRGPWLEKLDFSTLELVPSRYVSRFLDQRESDIVWRFAGFRVCWMRSDLRMSLAETAHSRLPCRDSNSTPLEVPTNDHKTPWSLLPLGLLAGFAAILYFSLVVYRPDRPVATIVPGSSSGPAFVVQIIRPRLGLPLGGIVPPPLFGLEAHLGFDSTSAGASIGRVSPERLELGADDWELVLALAAEGRVTPETQVVFKLMFEERLQRVRCRPSEPAIGSLRSTALAESGEFSGGFEIELARCEYAETRQSLGWPPSPLVVHGSFDRLPQKVSPKPARDFRGR